jgi:hypothetical protein
VSPRSGAGALLSRETEYADLGTHRGRALLLRLALGGGDRALQLRLGRARAVALEVREADGRRYDLPIETPPDPWLQTARRVLLTWLLAAAALGLAGRARRAQREDARGTV